MLMLELNQIYWGDNIELIKQLDNNCINLTVTSPPYDNLRNYNGYDWNFEGIAQELFRVTKDGGVVVWVVGDATINGSETGTSFRQALYFMECGFKLHDTMIYQKNGTGACGSNNCYWQSFEYMFVFAKGNIKTVNRLTSGKRRSAGGKKPGRFTTDGVQQVETRSSAGGKTQLRSNVWMYNVGFTNGDETSTHPATFPEKLAEDHIASWSNKGDLILDPFMGSGTTAKMALKNERNFVGFEISQEYVDLANKRIAGWKEQERLF